MTAPNSMRPPKISVLAFQAISIHAYFVWICSRMWPFGERRSAERSFQRRPLSHLSRRAIHCPCGSRSSRLQSVLTGVGDRRMQSQRRENSNDLSIHRPPLIDPSNPGNYHLAAKLAAADIPEGVHTLNNSIDIATVCGLGEIVAYGQERSLLKRLLLDFGGNPLLRGEVGTVDP
jgi:hypothetical protein